MNFYRSLNLRFISIAAIAIAIVACFNFGTPEIFAKSRIRKLSSRHLPSRQFPDSATNSATRVSDMPTDIPGAEKLATSEPSSENYINLSFAYWSAKRYRDCVTAARQALDLKPDNPIAYNNIAAGYQSIARLDSAIDASSEALRLMPDFQLAQNNLNWELAHLKRIGENVAMSERLVSVNQTSSNYVQLSQAYYDVWRYEDCIAAAYKALASTPDRVETALAYNNICAANNKLGQWDSAIVAGKEAVRIAPNFNLAKNNLRFAIQRASDTLASPVATPFVANSDSYRDATNPILPLASVAGTPASANGITLEPCYPNPASNYALISFSLSESSSAKLMLYDLVGREVESLYDGFADAGTYSITLNAASLSSGAYEYVLSTPSASLSRSIIISK